MTEAIYNCPTCRRRRVFEQPPCNEGHGENCPEWTCVVCGSALWVDLSADAIGVSTPLTHVA